MRSREDLDSAEVTHRQNLIAGLWRSLRAEELWFVIENAPDSRYRYPVLTKNPCIPPVEEVNQPLDFYNFFISDFLRIWAD